MREALIVLIKRSQTKLPQVYSNTNAFVYDVKKTVNLCKFFFPQTPFRLQKKTSIIKSFKLNAKAVIKYTMHKTSSIGELQEKNGSPKVLVHRLKEELVVWLVQDLFKIQQSDIFRSNWYLHQVRSLLLVDVIDYFGFRHL